MFKISTFNQNNITMYTYALLPIISWLIAGSIKFILNYINSESKVLELIGDGGFPSTHTTLITSVTTFIGLYEGINTPFFAISLTVLMITVFNALGIRKRVGQHAEILNRDVLKSCELRERSGHSLCEILGGLVIGFNVGLAYYSLT